MSASLTRFRDAFVGALTEALREAGIAGSPAPTSRIELHLHGTHDLTIDETVSNLFVSEDDFIHTIDVTLDRHDNDGTHFVVRIGDMRPVPWEQTLSPETFGPFNVATPA
ncbi:hypothetical protein ASE75_08380 [Sphingomonas sp. Leaf17]|uniref:hypothetical protein n=1 Tax=Sphingomonas sp. Leaf17 TaxID=1735683 RepID=UPI000701D902|nr:hypothetical protein [Sphingomonas sp. Leaf17]KQM65053.1 hypothetical protein ASE75_08380 [Sphingomonas sp. Leaf17]